MVQGFVKLEGKTLRSSCSNKLTIGLFYDAPQMLVRRCILDAKFNKDSGMHLVVPVALQDIFIRLAMQQRPFVPKKEVDGSEVAPPAFKRVRRLKKPAAMSPL
jgi:hypothetical protein